MSKCKILCVIPARLESSRLPRKMLADLQGKPLLQRTYESAKAVPLFDDVVVAVDCRELYDKVIAFGGRPLLTSATCASGTERLIELHGSKTLQADIWVNWQGDEPFINKEAIGELLQSCDNPEEEIWTLKRLIEKPEEIASPDVVKVVCDQKGNALYFSRSPIPHLLREAKVYKHVGLYGYSSSALEKIGSLTPTEIEKAESLEQLRFLYHGLSIRVHETSQNVLGVDTEEELLLAKGLYFS
ncbi:MAG: 3-deoxy-manno-octulosonate cytidylyltransferase [Chlamydiae bacterium]|nr:3-deoxy-manno-octulosonate cytidylyltransferase [Chlamydiota bacterium]